MKKSELIALGAIIGGAVAFIAIIEPDFGKFLLKTFLEVRDEKRTRIVTSKAKS